MNMNADKDRSLEPPEIVRSPGSEYLKENRQWQGIPGIEAVRPVGDRQEGGYDPGGCR
jgi:hypothetical protein